MTVIERIMDYAARANISRKVIYTACGIPQSTFTTWIKVNVTSIPSEHIPVIAKLLGVDCNMLLTGEKWEPEPVKERDDYIMDLYRQLDWDGQQMVTAKIIEEKRRMEARG